MADRQNEEAWWKLPLHALLEVIVGVVVFCAIGAAVFALHWVVGFLETKGIDSSYIYALRAVEYLVFIADVALLVRILWRAVKRAWT